MPPSKPSVKEAAQPKFRAYFDTWNSSSTGHQRAENSLGASTGWRQSRNMKLSYQFKAGEDGGKRVSDSVGAGSKDWDEKAKALITKQARARAEVSVGDMLTGGGTASLTEEEKLMAKRKKEAELKEEKSSKPKKPFDGLVIFINGSTHPLISDHKLKHTLAENGAKLSLHLGRRSVTHVVLGRPGTKGSSSGGGLSGTKIEKEIKRTGGCGIKYVGVEWVLESLKAGRRLPETQFSHLKTAVKGQQSVYDIFKKGVRSELSEGPRSIGS